MRLLAIDFGTKKCGIAITDPLQIISQPLKTIFYDNQEMLIKELNTIINEYKPIEKIIIGLPKNVDGEISNTGKIIIKFKNFLENKINIPIEFVDEKYTTKESIEIMREMNLNNSQKKQKKDSIAAQKILENYLSKKG